MQSEPDDARLVADAIEGSRGARRRLADRLLDVVQREVVCSLRRLAPSCGRDPRQEVRDLVQDVLVLLFEREARELRRWDPDRGRTLDSFVRLVARRRVARILGQGRGNPWADQPIDPQAIEAAGEASGDAAAFSQLLEDRHQLGVVLDALHARMSPRDAELFDMLFVRDLDPAEVADAMGMARGAVNTWRYRLRKLARSLALAATADEEKGTAANE